MNKTCSIQARIYVDKGCQTYTALAIHKNGKYSKACFTNKKDATDFIMEIDPNVVYIREIGA